MSDGSTPARETAVEWIGRLAEAAQSGHRTNREIISYLALFSPNSAGSVQARAACTLHSARESILLLAKVLDAAHVCDPADITAEACCSDAASRAAAEELGGLLAAQGSDKSTTHDYHLLYGPILAGLRESAADIFEIGLGSNNPDVMSHMGKSGVPGASLRAFRTFLPNARLVGADIDRRILFSEERIETFHLDQTCDASWDRLGQQLGDRKFDLVIDDGLHAPDANLAALAFSLNRLKPGGYFVVEDIHDPSLPIWSLVRRILPAALGARIVRARHGNLFAIRQPADPGLTNR